MGAQFFETSAKTGANVDLAVLALMREVLHHRDYSAKKITVAVDKKEGGRCARGKDRVFYICSGISYSVPYYLPYITMKYVSSRGYQP